MGGFNVHYCYLISYHFEFKSLINYLSLNKYILCKTHYLGNTLYIVLTNSDSDIGIPIKYKLFTFIL